MFVRAQALVVRCMLIALTCSCAAGAPLGPGFTYQGRLTVGGAPANGSYNVEFRLYDSGAGGAPLGSQTFPNLMISDGTFTTILNGEGQFGPAPFNGEARWLEIVVDGTPLSPRQALTNTPYAAYAARLGLPFDGSTNAAATALQISNSGTAANAWAISGTQSNAGNRGILGHPLVGVYGDHAGSGNYGGLGAAAYGAYGVYGLNNNAGYLGGSNYGVNAVADIYGVYALSSGQFVPSCGVHGGNTSRGHYGQLGTTGEGVYGWGANNGVGVQGETAAGTGVDGTGYNGVWGTSPSFDGNGVRGIAHNGGNAYGVWGYSTTGWAGTFSGKAQVTGNFYAGAKFFRIDHPLAPQDKYLVHACVESDEMKNVYDGVATLDPAGEAWVDLPVWFESLNSDFRYQLTCIGQPALVYVKEKLSGNRFLIAGGEAGVEVSWQITGVRRDAYARANAMEVELDKLGAERGQYLHPEAFGFDASRSVEAEKLRAAEAGHAETPRK